MTDKNIEKQARNEAIRLHMGELRTLSNQRPWRNSVNKGTLFSKHGTYLNWWQFGAVLVVIIFLLVYSLWGINRVRDNVLRDIDKLESTAIKGIGELKSTIQGLETEKAELTKELEDCRNAKNATPAEESQKS